MKFVALIQKFRAAASTKPHFPWQRIRRKPAFVRGLERMAAMENGWPFGFNVIKDGVAVSERVLRPDEPHDRP
jgi:hypothetical protein